MVEVRHDMVGASDVEVVAIAAVEWAIHRRATALHATMPSVQESLTEEYERTLDAVRAIGAQRVIDRLLPSRLGG